MMAQIVFLFIFTTSSIIVTLSALPTFIAPANLDFQDWLVRKKNDPLVQKGEAFVVDNTDDSVLQDDPVRSSHEASLPPRNQLASAKVKPHSTTKKPKLVKKPSPPSADSKSSTGSAVKTTKKSNAVSKTTAKKTSSTTRPPFGKKPTTSRPEKLALIRASNEQQQEKVSNTNLVVTPTKGTKKFETTTKLSLTTKPKLATLRTSTLKPSSTRKVTFAPKNKPTSTTPESSDERSGKVDIDEQDREDWNNANRLLKLNARRRKTSSEKVFKRKRHSTPPPVSSTTAVKLSSRASSTKKQSEHDDENEEGAIADDDEDSVATVRPLPTNPPESIILKKPPLQGSFIIPPPLPPNAKQAKSPKLSSPGFSFSPRFAEPLPPIVPASKRLPLFVPQNHGGESEATKMALDSVSDSSQLDWLVSYHKKQVRAQRSK